MAVGTGSTSIGITGNQIGVSSQSLIWTPRNPSPYFDSTGGQGALSVASGGNKRWVVVGTPTSGNSAIIFSNDDGASWTQVTSFSGGTLTDGKGVVYNNQTWIAIGASGAFNSVDGTSWTSIPTLSGGLAIACNNSTKWGAVVSSTQIAFSTDYSGSTWNTPIPSPLGITHGIGAYGSSWIVVGQAVSGFGQAAYAYSSDDGQNFTTVVLGLSENVEYLRAAARSDLLGTWILTGYGFGNLRGIYRVSSSNLGSWTPLTNIPSSNPANGYDGYGVVWYDDGTSNGRWVVVGIGLAGMGNILESTNNGDSWNHINGNTFFFGNGSGDKGNAVGRVIVSP
jgi:hypothetical protein